MPITQIIACLTFGPYPQRVLLKFEGKSDFTPRLVDHPVERVRGEGLFHTGDTGHGILRFTFVQHLLMNLKTVLLFGHVLCVNDW